MAGEALPLLVTAGVGVGMLAGVVSGVCYLLVHGLGWSRRVNHGQELREAGEDSCAGCGLPGSAHCAACALPLCTRCYADTPGPPRCRACVHDRLVFSSHLKGGNSFLRLLRDSFLFSSWSDPETKLKRSRVARPGRAVGGRASGRESGKESGQESGLESGLESGKESGKETGEVRDFLQLLAEKLAGGALDQVSVSRMYDHPDYLPLAEGESASNAHARLQSLVQRVIEEALRLPGLLEAGGPREPRLPPFSPHTYEDLLATAILNKVIDRYQHETKTSTGAGAGAGASSSGVHSGSSSPAGAPAAPRRRPRGRAARGLSPGDRDRSSPEPLSQDDYALSDSSGRASDTPRMKEEFSSHHQLESSTDDEGAFSASYSNPVDGALASINFHHKNRTLFPEYGGDIVDVNEKSHSVDKQEKHTEGDEFFVNGNFNMNSEIYANNSSWEENWLFQKKRMKTAQSVPVPMLIPNSNTEYRALIGDRDAEDTTDLSEAGSDTEESSTDIKQVLVNSKFIIGGKNPESVLSLIDADENEIDLQNGFHTDETFQMEKTSPLTQNFIESELLFSCTDENDNKTSTFPEIDIKPVILENHESSLDIFKLQSSTPTQEVSRKVSRNAMREFLRSLESVEESDLTFGMNSIERFPKSEHDLFEAAKVTEATNLDVVEQNDADNHESLDCHQQESEYTETVAIPVQRHIDSLRRQHNLSKPNLKEEKSTLIISEEVDGSERLPAQRAIPINYLKPAFDIEEITNDITEIQAENEIASSIPVAIYTEKDLDENIQFTINMKPSENNNLVSSQYGLLVDLNDENIEAQIPGSIAEREHKKWLNPVPMANNPYSPEAIQSRLNKQRSPLNFDMLTNNAPPTTPTTPGEAKTHGLLLQEALSEGAPEFKRYGRDYYINQSKRATGGKNKLSLDINADMLDSPISESHNVPLVRSSPEVTAPSWVKDSVLTHINNWDSLQCSKKAVQQKSEPELYAATPAIVTDVDAQFDDIYQKTFTFNSHDKTHDYVMPVDSNMKSTHDLIELNRVIADNDAIDQSDSVSSVDDSLRVYNLKTGTIVSRPQTKDYQQEDDDNTKMMNTLNSENSKQNIFQVATNKLWKSTGDVYSAANKDKDDIHISESKIEVDLELPSVKDLAKIFHTQSLEEPQIIKPKRRISKDLLENGIIHKSLSTSQSSLKQPLHKHSLTARSISKEFRDELKLSSQVRSNIHPGGSKRNPGPREVIREGKSPSRSGSPVPEPGSLKNKLEYFENLNLKNNI